MSEHQPEHAPEPPPEADTATGHGSQESRKAVSLTAEDTKSLGFFQTLFAVMAALFGVRSRAGFRRDLERGKPAYFILMGFGLFLLGTAILWVLVYYLTVYLVGQQGGL